MDRDTGRVAVEPEFLMPPAHWGLAGTIVWGVLISLAFVLVQTVTMFAVVGYGGVDVPGDDLEQIVAAASDHGLVVAISTFVTALVCGALIIFAIVVKKGAVVRGYLAMRPVAWKTLLHWLAILAAVLLASDLLSLALGRPVVPDVMITLYASADPVWLLWAALLVAAPLFEELMFRGFVFRGMETSVLGPMWTIFVTTLAWAAVHVQYDFYGMALVFAVGIILGFARWRTGSILVPIALHSAANLVAIFQTMLVG